MFKRKRAALIVALLGGLLTAGVAYAQSSASFDLSWNVLGGGGGESESVSFAAGSTIGQPLAGSSESASFQLDANCDGTVNAIDAAFILQFSAGLIGGLLCVALADANRAALSPLSMRRWCCSSAPG